MSRILRMHKGRWFAVEGWEFLEDEIYRIPTARKAAREAFITIKPGIDILDGLEHLINAYSFQVSEEAKDLLDKLRCERLKHRTVVRTARRQFKTSESAAFEFRTKNPPLDHQVRAVGFGASLDCSAFLMAPGTGKSFCTVALSGHRLYQHDADRMVIACPKTVVPVWSREYHKHADFPFQIKYVRSEEDLPRKFDGLAIAVVNYDMLLKLEKPLRKWKPSQAAADESHKMKNPTTIRAKAMRRLAERIQYRTILTGTLLGQSPLDVYGQYSFMNEDILGRSYKNFEQRYAVKGGYMGYEIIGYQNLEELSDKIHSVAFRCTEDECLDLPPQRNLKLMVHLDPKARRIYDEMNEEMYVEVDGQEISVDLVVSKLIKLRQITGGLVKTDGKQMVKVSEAKLPRVIQHLNSRSWEKKAVVFCTFLHEVEMVVEAARKEGYKVRVLTGATSDRERAMIQTEFQQPCEGEMLVSQIGVGAEGIDLYEANEDIFYSPTYSFIQYQQARARIRRLGQTHPVRHTHVLMDNTVDVDIMSFLQEHGDLTKKILDDLRDYKLRRRA